MSRGLVGSQLGKYHIVEELGQGGMSVVYQAQDTQLHRDVAVKVMHPFLAKQEEARERFRREAIAVARLRHPHIIEIYDYSGETAEASYIVTELVEGQALSKFLGVGGVEPPEAALLLARPIAQALHHAHSNHVIHRDLKPENILVGRDGSLKLTDFGIARMLDNQTLTITGTLLGSPAYMAPEYIEGETTDERSDIFSFGTMLYQFAVGKMPFEGSSPHTLLKRIVAGEVTPAEQANPQIPAPMARMLRRCLAVNPEDRYSSAALLLEEIDALLARLGINPNELVSLLCDRAAYKSDLEARLLPLYVKLGKGHLKGGLTGAAIEEFDRVLGLDPENPEVRRIVDRLARRAWFSRALRVAGLGIAGAAAVTVTVAMWPKDLSQALPTRVPSDRAEPQEPLMSIPPPARIDRRRNVTFVIQGNGDLYIDDTKVAEALAENHSELLQPGTHEVRLVSEGRTVSQTFDVAEQGAVEPVELDGRVNAKDAPRGPRPIREVRFNVAGSWANVEVDGKAVKKNAMGAFAMPLRFGTHALRFSNPGMVTREMNLLVSDADPPQTVVVRLEPKPARLVIRGAPEGALVEVAGERRVINAHTRGEPIFVPMGGRLSQEYEVVVTKEGLPSFRTRVTFRPGATQTLAIEMKPR